MVRYLLTPLFRMNAWIRVAMNDRERDSVFSWRTSQGTSDEKYANWHGCWAIYSGKLWTNQDIHIVLRSRFPLSLLRLLLPLLVFCRAQPSISESKEKRVPAVFRHWFNLRPRLLLAFSFLIRIFILFTHSFSGIYPFLFHHPRVDSISSINHSKARAFSACSLVSPTADLLDI